MTKVQTEALAVCDGVIEIAKNEMLIQGQFLSHNIVDRELRDRGSVCGGRQACLVGSMYLAYGKVPSGEGRAGIFSNGRMRYLRARPGLHLAYDAINEAAHRRILRGHRGRIRKGWDYTKQDYVPETPDEGWGEFYFETVLHNEDYADIRKHIITLCASAKRLIKAGEVE